jgi:methylenetetrahydrofolate reductase (NADPH)
MINDFSLEITSRDVADLPAAALPAGTRVNVTFLGGEDPSSRIAAVRAVQAQGLVPVPHLAARRLSSRTELSSFLASLPPPADVFVAGGDPQAPRGPFTDALSVIESGLLEEHGVERVSIAGYPEGHPHISAAVLWSSLEAKIAALHARGLGAEIITQFGFDADPVLDWIETVRARGIDVPVRIGTPGPVGVRRLLSYAARLGVVASLTDLGGTARPDHFVRALRTDYHPRVHGEVKLHFYTFGGLIPTSEWIADTLLG